MSPWRDGRAGEGQKTKRKWATSLKNAFMFFVKSDPPEPWPPALGCLRASLILASSRRHRDRKKRTRHSWRPKVSTPSTTTASLAAKGSAKALLFVFSWTQIWSWIRRRFTCWWLLRRGLPVDDLGLGLTQSQVLVLGSRHLRSSCRFLPGYLYYPELKPPCRSVQDRDRRLRTTNTHVKQHRFWGFLPWILIPLHPNLHHNLLIPVRLEIAK